MSETTTKPAIGLVLSEILNAIDQVRTIEHATFDELELALWSDAIKNGDLTAEELLDPDTQMGVFLEDGTEIEMDFEAVKRSIEDMGLYGFCHWETRTIHFWRNSEVSTPDLAMKFFAHELSHAFLDEPLWGDLDGSMLQEYRAEIVSAIAYRAYEWAFTPDIVPESLIDKAERAVDVEAENARLREALEAFVDDAISTTSTRDMWWCTHRQCRDMGHAQTREALRHHPDCSVPKAEAVLGRKR